LEASPQYPANYPRPPIVEAIVQFGFGQRVTRKRLEDGLRTPLRRSYPGPHKSQHHVEVNARVEPESVSASATRRLKVTFLGSANGLRLVGLADNVLSIHALAPYPGWDNLIANACDVVKATVAALGPVPLASIALRYIDRIALPGNPAELARYLRLQLGGGEELGAIADFSMQFRRVTAPNRDVTTLVVAATPPGADGMPAIAIDLVAATSQFQPCGLGDTDSWLPIASRLHHLQRSTFESIITDEMRGLFE